MYLHPLCFLTREPLHLLCCSLGMKPAQESPCSAHCPSVTLGLFFSFWKPPSQDSSLTTATLEFFPTLMAHSGRQGVFHSAVITWHLLTDGASTPSRVVVR